MHVKQLRAGCVDLPEPHPCLPDRMTDINAATHTRIYTFTTFDTSSGEMPQLIFWSVIVDRDTNIVFLNELLDPRQKFWRRVAGDNDADACSLAAFELASDVRIFILRKIDGSGSVKLDARGGVVREGRCFLLRIHREMILYVLTAAPKSTQNLGSQWRMLL